MSPQFDKFNPKRIKVNGPYVHKGGRTDTPFTAKHEFLWQSARALLYKSGGLRSDVLYFKRLNRLAVFPGRGIERHVAARAACQSDMNQGRGP